MMSEKRVAIKLTSCLIVFYTLVDLLMLVYVKNRLKLCCSTFLPIVHLCGQKSRRCKRWYDIWKIMNWKF